MEFNATFIVAFISFVIFIIIMNQILYKPISGIVAERKNLIDGNYQSARANKNKIEAIMQDRQDKLNNARSRVRQETAKALDEAKNERTEKENSAKSETKSKIEENITVLNKNRQDALNTLKNDVINLAQIISDKFIESPERIGNVDSETIEKLMQD